jgi:hypothetical protein
MTFEDGNLCNDYITTNVNVGTDGTIDPTSAGLTRPIQ